jgi:hypothetical protein
MSNDNPNRTERRGGYRRNAGRPKGSGEKTKICVSVNESNWQSAVSRWKSERSRKAKRSWLVDGLILAYLNDDVKIEAGAI